LPVAGSDEQKRTNEIGMVIPLLEGCNIAGTGASTACTTSATGHAFERTRRGGPSLASVGGGAPLNLDSLGLSSLPLMRSTTSSRSAMHPLPRNPNEWLTEIADAYADAFGALPFMPFVNVAQDESVLFHLAPRVAIKFRALSEQQADAATQAALSSYVASKAQVGTALDDPHLAFAFCYLAAQFGLEIVSEQTINEVMAFIEENLVTFGRIITEKTHNA
jgi:hypothetical protein